MSYIDDRVSKENQNFKYRKIQERNLRFYSLIQTRPSHTLIGIYFCILFIFSIYKNYTRLFYTLIKTVVTRQNISLKLTIDCATY